MDQSECDVAVVGAGAAGLAAALFTARSAPRLRVVALDGASRLGAKILVSGGGRCNVTNSVVREADFAGGPRTVVRRVLRAFSAADAAAFFRGLGVALHEEEHGKLFPDSNRARTVLDALVGEARARGVSIREGHRVERVLREATGFAVETSRGRLRAGRVVLATGGLSLPKTGSDGAGYGFARALGHSLVAPTPALVPLRLQGDWHAPLSGVAHDVELALRTPGRQALRIRGALLFTHFGVSGPAALDVSRHLLRARVEGLLPALSARLVEGGDAETIDRRLLASARERPRLRAASALSAWLPASLAEAVVRRLGDEGDAPLSAWPREQRRRLARALDDWKLPVEDSRGYGFAEVTAGGVPLTEIDPGTMESRLCPGLHLVGEILDVDGRLGGFNFQWSWSSGFVAARALAGDVRGAS